MISIIDPNNPGVVSEEIRYNTIFELAALIQNYNWAPGLFSERRRRISNFLKTELFVLDIDDGCSLDEARELFKEYKHIIATSRNHQKEKNGVTTDRFRVVLFIDGCITNDAAFKSTFTAVQRQWPFIDPSCKDSSRFYYRCIELSNVNATGRLIQPVAAPPVASQPDNRLPAIERDIKGELWKSTLSFLQFGAGPGQWHHEMFKAVSNMKEQGYSVTETMEMIETMCQHSQWSSGELDEHDVQLVNDIYLNRDTKYDYKPPEIKEQIAIRADNYLNEAFEYLADKEAVKGEPTGLTGLDKLLGGGFRLGELTVLMAEAKTGKNTLYHFLMHKQLDRGLAQGYASRELDPANEVVPNLISLDQRKNAWTSDFLPTDIDKIRKRVGSWDLWFAPGYGYFPTENLDEWVRTLYNQGVRYFWMDHLHYMLPEEDHKLAGNLMRHLKTLTKELKIHVNLIVQPNKLMEGQRLGLNTIKGGSAVGQALDNLMIMERVPCEQKGIAKLKLEVGRHKLARPGEIFLQYDPTTTSFIEVKKTAIITKQIAPRPIHERAKQSVNTPSLKMPNKLN